MRCGAGSLVTRRQEPPTIDDEEEPSAMRQVVMHAPGDVRVEDREDPTIIEPTDAGTAPSPSWPASRSPTAPRIR
ncbi:hypothetical protein Pve01_87290 [Planomonospora venezuelensis]|nr:hypothetical protein Pve01_87290 [Planomonospora venezuelensis]